MAGTAGEGKSESGGRPAAATKIISKGALLAIHSGMSQRSEKAPFFVPSFGPGDGYYVSVQIQPLRHAEIWRNGRHLTTTSAPSAGVHFFDMRERWRALVHTSFQSVTFAVPRESLIEAVDGRQAGPSIELPGFREEHVDTTLRHLAMALEPAFKRPSEVSRLFADHVLAAAAQHLVSAYRRSAIEPVSPAGGLAPWQRRRVCDRLLVSLDGEISIAELARECGLSPGYFAKAFRTSFGLPPHRWLMRERVRKAMDLMTVTRLPLDQIALACGFFDQAHLTRVFRAMVGHTPAAWRRDRGQPPDPSSQR